MTSRDDAMKPGTGRGRRLEPRGLSRTEAADYVGISASLFDELVQAGRMPKPLRINRRVLWDRRQLDEAFDNLDAADRNPWDDAA